MNKHIKAYSEKYFKEIEREHAYLLQFVVITMIDNVRQSDRVLNKANAFIESLCEDIGTEDITISFPME